MYLYLSPSSTNVAASFVLHPTSPGYVDEGSESDEEWVDEDEEDVMLVVVCTGETPVEPAADADPDADGPPPGEPPPNAANSAPSTTL